jgi:NAD-dependent SIR2 family protein deacetylase
MDAGLFAQLVASIQQGKLVIFCGAGLSMGLPSTVPSAGVLTGQIIADYNLRGLPALPPAATVNLETLSEHLFANGYQTLFVRDLVRWRPFKRDPNAGHQAVADFLTSSAVRFAVTTNFDELVEVAATELGENAFNYAVDSNSANINHGHNTYLKIHGCVRDPDHTLWCHGQLNRPAPVSTANQTIRDRIASSTGWLQANLPEKDIIFVGFWSDWIYLNDVFANYFHAVHGSMVVLVDPQPAAALEAKAPALWAWAQANGNFHHVPEYGNDFLNELRAGFSKNVLERVLLSAVPGFNIARAGVPVPPTDFNGVLIDDLYALRRDVGGVPSGQIPKYFQPDGSMHAVGRTHLLLRHAGATLTGSRYIRGGNRFRVVNGRTKLISQIKQEFSAEAPAPPSTYDEIVVCAGGSDDGGVPSHIIRGGTPPTVVRAGTVARWISYEKATDEGLF